MEFLTNILALLKKIVCSVGICANHVTPGYPQHTAIQCSFLGSASSAGVWVESAWIVKPKVYFYPLLAWFITSVLTLFYFAFHNLPHTFNNYLFLMYLTVFRREYYKERAISDEVFFQTFLFSSTETSPSITSKNSVKCELIRPEETSLRLCFRWAQIQRR